jgi:hypothetical protein
MVTTHNSMLFLVAAIGATIAIPAHAVLIDDFTDASSLVVDPGPDHEDAITPDAAPFGSIIGGHRQSQITNSNFGLPVRLETKVGTGISDSVMSYSAITSSTRRAGIFALVYNSDGAGLGGGAGEDLTIGGHNAFEIVVNLAANVSPTLVLGVIDADDVHGYAFNIALPEILVGGSPESILIPFAAFLPLAQVDFDRITQVSLDAHLSGEPTTAVSFEIVSLNTTFIPVPEPTTLAGLSLSGMLVLTRRCRSSF